MPYTLLDGHGRRIAPEYRKTLMFYRARTKRAFQESYLGLEDRWSIVSAHLPPRKSWILDVGSNLGDTARRVAEVGHVVVGIEPERHIVERAMKTAREHVAMMVGKVDPGFFETMPRFDAVLFLSVLHRIWAVQGRLFTEECLKACLKKTDLVIVEGAIRHHRYTDHGQAPPEFESNNLVEGAAWHLQWFKSLATCSGDWRVESIGHVPASRREPYRPLFLLSAQK